MLFMALKVYHSSSSNEILSIIQRIDPNACTMTSASKGILVQRKDTKLEKMPVEFEEYVTVYLQEKGILGSWNESEWSPLMKEVKYILLQGKLYRPGCDIIVKKDLLVATPYKAKIRSFFISRVWWRDPSFLLCRLLPSFARWGWWPSRRSHWWNHRHECCVEQPYVSLELHFHSSGGNAFVQVHESDMSCTHWTTIQCCLCNGQFSTSRQNTL